MLPSSVWCAPQNKRLADDPEACITPVEGAADAYIAKHKAKKSGTHLTTPIAKRASTEHSSAGSADSGSGSSGSYTLKSIYKSVQKQQWVLGQARQEIASAVVAVNEHVSTGNASLKEHVSTTTSEQTAALGGALAAAFNSTNSIIAAANAANSKAFGALVEQVCAFIPAFE